MSTSDSRPSPASAVRVDPAVIIVGACIALVAIAAFLPWATAFGFSAMGIKADGAFTFGAAVLGALFMLSRNTAKVFLPAETILGCAVTTVGFIDLFSVESAVPAEFRAVAGAGSGLYLTALGGAIWAGAALFLAGRHLLTRSRLDDVPGAAPTPSAPSPPAAAAAATTDSSDASSPGARKWSTRTVAIVVAAALLAGCGITAAVILSSDGSTSADRTESTPNVPGSTSTAGLQDGGAPRGNEPTPVSDAVTADLVGDRFQSPTGNLQCQIFGGHGQILSCARLNDGFTVDLTEVGRARTHTDPDAGLFSEEFPTLAYGQTWAQVGPGLPTFVCTSSADGIGCASFASRQAFFLNRTTFRRIIVPRR